jgi:hypothetical protein
MADESPDASASSSLTLRRIPIRHLLFRTGPSTPRSVRFNDALWKAFHAQAHARGWEALDVVRWLMEDFINGEIAVPEPETRGSAPSTQETPDHPTRGKTGDPCFTQRPRGTE